MPKSIVEYYQETEKHRCGYCKKPDTNWSKGMWAHSMTIQDYQSLMNRGWRRSGQYCYKPIMSETCCPMYTIKCDALDFKLTKSQKKLLKKFSKAIVSEKNNGGESTSDSTNPLDEKQNEKSQENTSSSSSQEYGDVNNDHLMEMSSKKHLEIEIDAITASNISKDKLPRVVENKIEVVKDDISNIPCKKARQIRIERKKDRLLKKGIEWNPQTAKAIQKNPEKTLEDFMKFLTMSDNFEIKLVRSSPPSSEWKETSKETHELFVKYQGAIHDEPPSKCTEKQYQRFLVCSPLIAHFSENDIPMGYGSFHQQYWLNNKLIAVGVIDIMPYCVSSVYFYYDPKYSYLSLGTFGALQEIYFTRNLQKISPNIKHYYLGYYIHSCPKMRYKGNYAPSFLLCPESYKWFPIEECKLKIEVSPYSRLNPDLDELDEDSCEERDLKDMGILVGNTFAKYSQYKPKLLSMDISSVSDTESTLLEYGNLVGKKCSQNMLYVI